MQAISDPQTFETSEIVEKSSKSGIFSNKRLLVIKGGFLYYFTNVPAQYKSHVPNLLNTLKELPKSSIELKAIQTIKLQSAKSSNLIINFHSKDMIDRQDIRKSISSKNFAHPTKKDSSGELQEWKFTFSTVLQCRLWYSSLVKLKQYFIKQNDKIVEFMSTFDPQHRASLVQKTEPSKSSINISSPETKQTYTGRASMPMDMRNATFQVILEEKEQNDEEPITPPPKKQENIMSGSKIKRMDTIKEESENKDDSNIRISEQQIRTELQAKIRIQQQQRAEQKIEKVLKRLQERDKAIDKLQNQLKQSKKTQQQLQQKAIEEAMKRQQEQARRYELQRQRRQEEEYKRLSGRQQVSPIIERTPETQRYQMKEQEIQTQEEDFIYISSPDLQSAKSRISIKSDTKMTIQRDTRQTTTLFRNTLSLIQDHQEFQQYDFYEEAGKIYNDKASKFNDKLEKQVKLKQFVNKMKKISSQLTLKYIQENKPKSKVKIERGTFMIEIVCQTGKIINIEGREKLVYSNKEHQRLKQLFKINNKLNNDLFRILKKKPSCNLRLPLCFLFEIQGYTALAIHTPQLLNSQIIPPDASKYADILLSGLEKRNFKITQMANKKSKLYLIECIQHFKITKQDSFAIVQQPYCISDFLRQNRLGNISISTDKLLDEMQLSPNREKIQFIKNLRICRSLKKMMKSNLPFNDNSQVIATFISRPQVILSLTDSFQEKVKLTGSLFDCIEHLLGIKLKTKFTSFNKIDYEFHPVTRSFDLSALEVHTIVNNFDRYITEQRLDLAQNSFSYLQRISDNQGQVALKEIHLMIKFKLYEQALSKLSILNDNLSPHDLLRVEIGFLQAQCLIALERQMQLLICLRQLLELTQLMFSDQCTRRLDVFFLIGQSLTRQGNIEQSIGVYRRILQQNDSYKHSIYLNLSKQLFHQHRADPHLLIDFINEFLHKTEDQNEIVAIWIHLGELYLAAKNKDKSLMYFQKAFSFNLQHPMRQKQQLVDCYAQILKTCNSIERKKNYHKQLCTAMIGQHNASLVRPINNLTSIQIISTMSNEQRESLIDFFIGMTEGENHNEPDKLKLLQWSRIQLVFSKIAGGKQQRLNQDQLTIFQNIDSSYLRSMIQSSNPIKFM